MDDAAAHRAGPRARLADLIATAMAWKPVRVVTHYTNRRGPILAAGLSYHAIFATFAALWVGFSTIGIVLKGNVEFQAALFAIINGAVPGLVATGDTAGAIDADALLTGTVLTWTGAFALVVLLWTALSWFSSARSAVRTIFDLPDRTVNFFLLKLTDLGLAVGFGIALLASAALSVFSTAALSALVDFLNLTENSVVVSATASALGLVTVFVIDTAVLAVFFRRLAGLTIPFRQLATGSALGALGLGTLKALGSLALGGATRNPLLTSFAIFVGLLIWFNLICQVLLLAASWIATSLTDRGIAADPVVEAARLEELRRQREEMHQQIMEEERASAVAEKRGFFSRVFGRGRRP